MSPWYNLPFFPRIFMPVFNKAKRRKSHFWKFQLTEVQRWRWIFLEEWRLGWSTQPQKIFSGGEGGGNTGGQTVSLVQVQLLVICAQLSMLFENDVLFFIISLSMRAVIGQFSGAYSSVRLGCPQPLYLRTWKKKRAKRARSTRRRGWGLRTKRARIYPVRSSVLS